ncbi:hypothetical protein UAS_01675 [Enterococcus asini ATCC 700915]|uniref:SGNH hydrolase-type esterase domain-containing protein n=1 Tax=Enterococcus asini ATCC 700915 TaxID=1158606 RepID=R2SCZ8_9ENTE|nr:GDSL-type esterase/lipase family protein [Enterococcus asini]EOH85984.1 hypothetical protein UAS_01675 [Enterococcus asini ATCC 700915]EOT57859.1 hypothetical protein I579_01419 [Enterococcus asini ATCC 700915]
MKKTARFMNDSSNHKSWESIWSYCQLDYRSWPSTVIPDHQKIKVKMNHDTKEIRLRFSNEYGRQPLRFEQVTINVNGKLAKVTVNQSTEIDILPGANLISDPVQVTMSVGDVLIIDTYTMESVELTGGIVTYSKLITQVTNYQLEEQIEQKDLFRMVAENNRMQYIYGISEIQIPQSKGNSSIVFFGDSLVQQGYIVDGLKLRVLERNYPNLAVLNAGIGGSRVLKGTDRNFDDYQRHGTSGLERFEKDIYSRGQVDSVIVLHGINDLITLEKGSEKVTIYQLIQGLGQYAEIAHSHGSLCYIGTLMPFGESIFYEDKLEEYRQEVNNWIRNNNYYDGYFDFDLAVASKQHPSRLNSECDNGDGLHLSEEGGRVVAETISIPQLQKKMI